jgi:hypothetical protein
MATLVENANAVKSAAAAIDAAIVAKGGTTAGGLRNAAAAIAALPSGGDGDRLWDYFNRTLEGDIEINGVEWLQNNLKGQARMTSFSSDARHLTNYMFAACTALETVNLPNFGGTYNNDGQTQMFADCTSLRSISLPSCVTLREFTFLRCTALEEVHLPALTKFTYYGNFAECSSLRRIEVPNFVPVRIMGIQFMYGTSRLSNCTVDVSNSAAVEFFDVGVDFGAFLAATSCIKTSDGYIRYVDRAWTHTED